jgi:hypothetical protein
VELPHLIYKFETLYYLTNFNAWYFSLPIILHSKLDCCVICVGEEQDAEKHEDWKISFWGKIRRLASVTVK